MTAQNKAYNIVFRRPTMAKKSELEDLKMFVARAHRAWIANNRGGTLGPDFKVAKLPKPRV